MKGYCRQPDSGNPTVRDEKRAERKRQSRGTVNPPHIPKGCVTETLRLKLHALFFYSTLSRFKAQCKCRRQVQVQLARKRAGQMISDWFRIKPHFHL